MDSKREMWYNVVCIAMIIMTSQLGYGWINRARVHYSIDTDISFGNTLQQNHTFTGVINIQNKGNYPAYGYIIIKLYNASLVDDSYNIQTKKYHDEVYFKYNLTSNNEIKERSIMFEVNEGCTYSMVSISCVSDWSNDYIKDYFESFTEFKSNIPITIMFKENNGFYTRSSEAQMQSRMNLLRAQNFL